MKFQGRSDRPSRHSSSSVHQSETRQTSRREPLAQDVGQLPDARQLEHRDQDRRGRKPQSQGCRKTEAVLGPRKFPIFLVESYLLKANYCTTVGIRFMNLFHMFMLQKKKKNYDVKMVKMVIERVHLAKGIIDMKYIWQ